MFGNAYMSDPAPIVHIFARAKTICCAAPNRPHGTAPRLARPPAPGNQTVCQALPSTAVDQRHGLDSRCPYRAQRGRPSGSEPGTRSLTSGADDMHARASEAA